MHNEFAIKEGKAMTQSKESCVIALQIKNYARRSQIRTSQDKDKTKNTNKGWCRIVNTLRQGHEVNSYFQKALKEKVIPPLRVAETGPAWLWQAAADDRRVRCQMVTRSAATGTKSRSQFAALKQRYSPRNVRSKTQPKIEQPDESCVFGVSCCVGPAGGWVTPTCTPFSWWEGRLMRETQISKGSWRSAHCHSGCSWDPAAEVEQQAGNDIMTLTPIGWKHEEVLGNRAPGVTRKWHVALILY